MLGPSLPTVAGPCHHPRNTFSAGANLKSAQETCEYSLVDIFNLMQQGPKAGHQCPAVLMFLSTPTWLQGLLWGLNMDPTILQEDHGTCPFLSTLMFVVLLEERSPSLEETNPLVCRTAFTYSWFLVATSLLRRPVWSSQICWPATSLIY